MRDFLFKRKDTVEDTAHSLSTVGRHLCAGIHKSSCCVAQPGLSDPGITSCQTFVDSHSLRPPPTDLESVLLAVSHTNVSWCLRTNNFCVHAILYSYLYHTKKCILVTKHHHQISHLYFLKHRHVHFQYGLFLSRHFQNKQSAYIAEMSILFLLHNKIQFLFSNRLF